MGKSAARFFIFFLCLPPLPALGWEAPAYVQYWRFEAWSSFVSHPYMQFARPWPTTFGAVPGSLQSLYKMNESGFLHANQQHAGRLLEQMLDLCDIIRPGPDNFTTLDDAASRWAVMAERAAQADRRANAEAESFLRDEVGRWTKANVRNPQNANLVHQNAHLVQWIIQMDGVHLSMEDLERLNALHQLLEQAPAIGDDGDIETRLEALRTRHPVLQP